jgi:hypothetical protein
MNEKTVSRIIWAVCILAPLLPTYMVLAVITPVLTLLGVIVISLIEYFGFMYIIALFINRVAQYKLNKEKKQEEMIE